VNVSRAHLSWLGRVTSQEEADALTADRHDALIAAAGAVLGPLARLMVARGVPCAALEHVLQKAFVEAARAEIPKALQPRATSRISAATGLSRREVARLVDDESPPVLPQRSLAAEIFTRWRTSPAYCDDRGRPRSLPRQGAAPSFEALARSVTQDVHPRTLLDELIRLGIAGLVPERDLVVLTLDAFVPGADEARMLDFLARNVGDHLGVAVDNVLGKGPRQLERAIFATGLSRASVQVAQAWVEQSWQSMLAQLTPLLEDLLARDAEAFADDERPCRFRAGLYSSACGDAPRDHAEALAASLSAPVPARQFEHDILQEFSPHERH
jgi:hypothetical protein